MFHVAGPQDMKLNILIQMLFSPYSVQDTLPTNRRCKDEYDIILALEEFKEELKESRALVGFNTLTKHILTSGPVPYSLGEKNLEC